jgi:hypothetical protein
MQSAQGQHHSGAKFLGFPLEGFSLFQSLLLALTSAFFTFFSTTTLSIFALLAYNLIGHHTVNYADSYLYVGLPAAVIVLLIALPLFGTLWIRAKVRR